MYPSYVVLEAFTFDGALFTLETAGGSFKCIDLNAVTPHPPAAGLGMVGMEGALVIWLFGKYNLYFYESFSLAVMMAKQDYLAREDAAVYRRLL